MADPTTKERQQFARAGWAMPDGSYYIRPGHPKDLTNAVESVGRASGTNGVSDEEQRDAVRRHIIKRAKDLGRSDEIPSTWNSDGTLKHSEPFSREILLMHADDVDVWDFLEHFGVKGMHWGIRHAKSREELIAKAKQHETTAKAHASEAERYRAEADDLEKNGVNSEAFKRVYGKFAGQESDREFYGKNLQSKAQALQQTHNNLRVVHNHYARSANSHTKKAAKLRAQAERADPVEHSVNDDYFLEHFGRKGMKWGEHIFGKGDSNGRNKAAAKAATDHTASPDSRTASDLQARVNASGTKNLTNKELQDLVTRMNLEQQYSKLSSGDVKKGQSFVQKYNTHTQSYVTAVKVSKEAIKILAPLIVAGAAAAAASKASNGSGPIKMPRLAIES